MLPLLRVRRNSALYSNTYLYFETVATTGSIRGASERLHISPSAISHQLALLEEEFGTPLLRRVPKGVRPMKRVSCCSGSCRKRRRVSSREGPSSPR